MNDTKVLIAFSVFLICANTIIDAQTSNDVVDFARDIRPILQQHCYRCHGSQQQESGLRLDSQVAANSGGDSGEPLFAKTRQESLLFQRVTGSDGNEQMPPDSEPLSKDSIDLIGRWIDQGARWPDDALPKQHWAYVSPKRPTLPAVQGVTWPKSEIDFFVLAELERHDLAPSKRSDQAKLLRRVYLDLIGIPPSVAEIDAFLADRNPDKYENVVDQLLQSPHYGERWAVPWLDAARYADSNGYQADQYREVWPYRDWVVNAMNSDMPFDQFTLEQIAGDLLPESTNQQKIATGFHRQTPCNVEAGVDPEENRVNQIFDRVNTTGIVWLGTTLECAQCHDHKYDPFDQQDYYRLFAYFNNTPLEVKHTTATTYDFYGPKIDIPLPENSTAEQRELKAQFQNRRQELEEYLDLLTSSQAEWESNQKSLVAEYQAVNTSWHAAEVVDFVSTGEATHSVLDDKSILIGGARPDKDTYTVSLRTELQQVAAIKLDALTHPSLPGNGPGRHHEDRPNFVLNQLRLYLVDGKEIKNIPLALDSAWADYSQPQFDVAGAIDDKLNTGWAIHKEFHKSHVATFSLLEPLTVNPSQSLRLVLEQNHGGCRNLGRFRVSFCPDQLPATTIPDNGLPPDLMAILSISPDGRTETQQDQIVDFYRNSQPKFHQLSEMVESLKKQLGDAMSATTLVMVEMDDARDSRILNRGEFLKPLENVSAGTPRILHENVAKDGNRIDLAQWLVHRDNPLTARVIVNRWWAEIFGQGIVSTTEDFGTQGETPSHPELLDWLAVEFMENGWSMKHIHKLIVTSATYQQASHFSNDQMNQDPQNRLLSRGPRFRLGAEAIRDNALKISGLLSNKLGGPPAYPPQPQGVWRHVGRNAPKYKTAEGEERYRRGLYVVWRRSAPYPSFVNFDAPDRAACVVKRNRANTPLQALTLLNDAAYVEMAWAFARRIAEHRGTSEDKIRFGFRSCVARELNQDEFELLQNVFVTESARFENDPKSLKQVLGKHELPEGVSAKEFAAWFFVASILLNLDETITKG